MDSHRGLRIEYRHLGLLPAEGSAVRRYDFANQGGSVVRPLAARLCPAIVPVHSGLYDKSYMDGMGVGAFAGMGAMERGGGWDCCRAFYLVGF